MTYTRISHIPYTCTMHTLYTHTIHTQKHTQHTHTLHTYHTHTTHTHTHTHAYTPHHTRQEELEAVGFKQLCFPDFMSDQICCVCLELGLLPRLLSLPRLKLSLCCLVFPLFSSVAWAILELTVETRLSLNS